MADGQERSFADGIKHALEPVAYWGNNGITIAGVIITTAVSFTMFYTWVVFDPAHVSPYAGIAMNMILPTLFVVGLLLIPAGMLRRRIRAHRRGQVPAVYPPLDLNSPTYRRPLAIVVILTIVNVAILITATYRGVAYMDSVQFCGLTCHKVMQPEYTAYQGSPHARVECVGCHIGPGASWFVRSKLSGSYQVYAVLFHKYPRPIPTPVANLRPARETCEQCHWPAKFTGDRMVIKNQFKDDETNTHTQTVLLMRVGGEDPITHKPIGIHGVHMAGGTVIRYLATDRQRQEIPLVTIERNGTSETYTQTGVTLSAEQKRAPMRVMDCVDCHNRPSHNMQLPEAAVDQMMAAGKISPVLPFAKKKAVELLKATYGSRDDASAKIGAAFRDYYRTAYPQLFTGHQLEVNSGADAVTAIYLRNIFPDMKIEWGSYPNNIGHMNAPGCFRCHDGSHNTEKGASINMDCGACHNLLAQEEANPKVLQQLGITQQ